MPRQLLASTVGLLLEKFGILSARLKEEYDCKEKKQRILFMALYSGHMGKDETVEILSEPEGSWQQPLVGGLAEALWKYACGK